jgi:hypothetical protein
MTRWVAGAAYGAERAELGRRDTFRPFFFSIQ